MFKRAMLYVVAATLSLAGVCLTGGCDLLEPPSLDSYSSDELIDELLDRGLDNLGGLFGDDE